MQKSYFSEKKGEKWGNIEMKIGSNFEPRLNCGRPLHYTLLPLNKFSKTRIFGSELSFKMKSQTIFLLEFWTIFLSRCSRKTSLGGAQWDLYFILIIYCYRLVSKCHFESKRPRAVNTLSSACDVMYHLNHALRCLHNTNIFAIRK